MVQFKELNAFSVYHTMMSITGIWPKKNPDKFYMIRTSVSWFLSIGVTAAMCVEAVNDLGDFTKLSEILYILMTWAAYLTKLIGFTSNRKVFWDVLNFLENPVFMSHPDDLDHYMVNYIKFANVFSKTLVGMSMSCGITYLIYPLLDNIPLPFPFPYDLGKYRFLMYIFQSAGELCAAWNNFCLDTLCWCLMGLAIAQLDILIKKIPLLLKEEDSEVEACEISEEAEKFAIAHLKQCVEHHLAIIKLIGLIERVFTAGLLVQLLASVISTCNTLFHFVLISLSFQYILLSILFIGLLIQLFIYCWYGNEIIIKSVNVGEACYMSEWNRYGIEVRKYLFIIMERSKRPLKITTLKLSTLSLATYGCILQWSYSVLALLLNMYSKRSLE